MVVSMDSLTYWILSTLKYEEKRTLVFSSHVKNFPLPKLHQQKWAQTHVHGVDNIHGSSMKKKLVPINDLKDIDFTNEIVASIEDGKVHRRVHYNLGPLIERNQLSDTESVVDFLKESLQDDCKDIDFYGKGTYVVILNKAFTLKWHSDGTYVCTDKCKRIINMNRYGFPESMPFYTYNAISLVKFLRLLAPCQGHVLLKNDDVSKYWSIESINGQRIMHARACLGDAGLYVHKKYRTDVCKICIHNYRQKSIENMKKEASNYIKYNITNTHSIAMTSGNRETHTTPEIYSKDPIIVPRQQSADIEYLSTVSVNKDKITQVFEKLKQPENEDHLKVLQFEGISLLKLSTVNEFMEETDTEKNVFWCISSYRPSTGFTTPVDVIRDKYKNGHIGDESMDIVETMTKCFPKAVIKSSKSKSTESVQNVQECLPDEVVSFAKIQKHLLSKHIKSTRTSTGLKLTLHKEKHLVAITFPDLTLTFDKYTVDIKNFGFPQVLDCTLSSIDTVRHFVDVVNVCNGSVVTDLHRIRMPQKNCNYMMASHSDENRCTAYRLKHTECNVLTIDTVCPICKVAVRHIETLTPNTVEREMNESSSQTKTTNLNSYVCGVCKKVFKNFDTLHTHLDRHRHSNVTAKMVSEDTNDGNCQGSAANATEEISYVTNPKYRCEWCKMGFSCMLYLVRHRNRSKCESRQCMECGEVFETVNQCRTHMVTHRVVKFHECPICQKKFGRKDNFKVHLTIHAGIKNHSCDICKKSFRERAHLKKHMQIHVHGENLECSECHKKYMTPKTLENHKQNIHGVCGKSSEMLCEICGKNFSSAAMLRFHVLRHKTKPSTSKSTNPTKHRKSQCKNCGKFFSRLYIALHIRSYCGKQRKSRNSYIKVINNKFTNSKCDVCNETFSDASKLSKHFLDKHIANTCEICGKMFSRASTLAIHVKSHSGFTTFKCDLCDYEAASRSAFNSHIRSQHKKIKTIRCSFCGKYFATKSSLDVHVANYHVEENITCSICKKKLSSVGALRRHMYTHASSI